MMGKSKESNKRDRKSCSQGACDKQVSKMDANGDVLHGTFFPSPKTANKSQKVPHPLIDSGEIPAH